MVAGARAGDRGDLWFWVCDRYLYPGSGLRRVSQVGLWLQHQTKAVPGESVGLGGKKSIGHF